jgi:hypothetical protein
MAFKFDIKSVFFAGLLLNACAPETPDPSHPGATTGNATAETKDAGAKADAGKDAGKKDAGSTPDEGDEPADEPTDDDTSADDNDDSSKPSVGGAKADAGGSTTGDAGSAGDTCADLTYEKFGKTFLDTYCLTCHTKMMPMFTTLAQVTTNKTKIKAEAATGTAMPPKGSKAPTADERAKLGKWLDCGPK